MKEMRQRLKEPAVQLLAVGLLALVAAAFAFNSYQSWQGWRQVHGQLNAYVKRPLPAGQKSLVGKDGSTAEAIDELAVRHGVALLSQHASGSKKDVQTLVLEGDFTALLSLLNDMSGLFPQRPCRLIEMERRDAGCVLTFEF